MIAAVENEAAKKPQQIKDKILEGKLNRALSENVLEMQQMGEDGKSVSDYLKQY